MAKKKVKQFYGTGRRKTSVARVFLKPGKGEMTINGRELQDYFPLDTLQTRVNEPISVAKMENRFDIYVTVKGGGISSQAGAVQHGLARALISYDTAEGGEGESGGAQTGALGLKKVLRQAGLVTRDARIVERKKVGLHKARKRAQYSKR